MKITIIPFIYKKIEISHEEMLEVLGNEAYRPVRWWFLKLIKYPMRTQ